MNAFEQNTSQITTQSFDPPVTVRVEATWKEMCRQEIDFDERWDFLYDIARIDPSPTHIRFVKVRTIERPTRGEIEIPREALETIKVYA